MKLITQVSFDQEPALRVISVDGNVMIERYQEFDEPVSDNWVKVWEGHDEQRAMNKLVEIMGHFTLPAA